MRIKWKDKSEIGANLVYSSDEGADNLTNDDLSQSASMYGGASQTGREESKRGDLSRKGTMRSNTNNEISGQRPSSR